MSFQEFMYKYFGKTIAESSGYNVVNTLIYALIAIVLYFYAIRKFVIDKLFKKIDFNFCFTIILFVIWGSMIRVMEEPYSTVDIFPKSINPLELGFYFTTPGIYFMITAFVLIVIGLAYLIEKKWKIEKIRTMQTIGFVLVIPTFIFMLTRMTFAKDFFLYLLLIAVIVAIIYSILKMFKITLAKTEVLAITGQTIDGIATFGALTFYPFFKEQHFASDFVMQNVGTWAFPTIKILITLGIIYYLRKHRDNFSESDINYILLFIALFGFATGVRDLFSIACHVI